MRVWLYTTSGCELLKEGNPCTPEMTVIFLRFKVFFMAYPNDPSQYSVIVLALKPTIKMLSAISNTLGSSLMISSILHWNMSPAWATVNSSLTHLYLPNWHEEVVK